MARDERQGRRLTRTRRTLTAVAGFLFIVGFFLTTEQRAHLFGALPFLLLLLCPLLHVFMHGGHGSHGDVHGDHGGSSMTDVTLSAAWLVVAAVGLGALAVLLRTGAVPP